MSRVDQAWKRASAGAIRHWEIAPRAEHPEQSDQVVLHHYHGENGSSGNSPQAPERLPDRTLVALRPEERRQLGPLHGAFERKLVVGGKAPPIAIEQYRRLAGALHELQVEQELKTLMVTSAVTNVQASRAAHRRRPAAPLCPPGVTPAECEGLERRPPIRARRKSGCAGIGTPQCADGRSF